MPTIQEITLLVYNISLLPVIFFSILYLFVAFLNIFFKTDKNPKRFSGKYPFITVQIPVFNDAVAKECIEKCMAFDYPKNRYEIMILDDSTDRKLAKDLKSYSEGKYSIRYIHRKNRDGYKPGALKDSMHLVKGEIVVIFDSDWKPGPDFLKKIIKPMMEDENVAIVQAKQTFVNLDNTLVSRFAGYLLMIYHSLFMPIHNKANSVFFCGTAGAIRRDILEEAGGWNTNSITEDADLSVRILSMGYKNVYVDLPVPSEVPETIESFIKQQMRWSYGQARTFFDNYSKILFSKKIGYGQRFMIIYNTLATVIAPVVLAMTFFGMVGWFLGEPELFKLNDLTEFFSKFIFTSGFLLLGVIALFREKQIREIPYLVLGTFSVSLVLIAFNTYAFTKAVLKQDLYWYRTPKYGSVQEKIENA